MNIRFGHELWGPTTYTVGQMLGDASREISRWYRYDGNGLAGLSRDGSKASSHLLTQTVESLKGAVNRQNYVLQALVKKHPGILDELA